MTDLPRCLEQYKYPPATPGDHLNAVHRQAVYSCVFGLWISLLLCWVDLVFLGSGKGHTRGVLSASTSATIGRRFLPWLVSNLIFFLSPVLLLAITISHGLAAPVFEQNPQSIGLGFSLISGYWGLTSLVLGRLPTIAVCLRLIFP